MTTTGRILVVDDDRVSRLLLAGACRRLGHDVDTAEDGAAALVALRAGGAGYDVVLLDLLMPVLDGFGALAQIKSDPALAHLPVIVVSALDELGDVVRCIEMGAADHLCKPFEPALLRARLDASLAAKRMREAELHYLRRVDEITAAAREVEAGRYRTDGLDEVAAAGDALGGLARVFRDLVRVAAAREAALRHTVEELRIRIDAQQQARELAEITGTEYFQTLRSSAEGLKRIMKGEP